MRIEASAACLSWIPPTAVEGTFRLPFGLGIAHYDQPPPDVAPDIDALLAADAIRFANRLHAWIETENGRIVKHGMSGAGALARPPSGSAPTADLRRRRAARPHPAA